MYPVSNEFLQAVQENTRRYHWTGRIMTTSGTVYEFSEKDIVKGSGYISSQCCGSTEIELGTVYSSEMGITLLSEIDRYTLEDAQIELWYHLLVGDAYESVPMGIFEISEANRCIRCLEIKACKVTFANVLDVQVIGTGAVLRTAVIFFYLSNEGISLLENAAYLGLPIPEKLKLVLEQIHEKAEEGEAE